MYLHVGEVAIPENHGLKTHWFGNITH